MPVMTTAAVIIIASLIAIAFIVAIGAAVSNIQEETPADGGLSQRLKRYQNSGMSPRRVQYGGQ